MNQSQKVFIIICLSLFSVCAIPGEGFSEGTPVAVLKTDYGSLHLTFVQTSSPVNNPANCGSNTGLVVHDANPSAKAAVTFALMALSTGMKFQCYVLNECSTISGNATTFPVCGYYPTVKQ